MNGVRIEVPNWKVIRIEINPEMRTAMLYRNKGAPIECYLLDFSWGPQGTWVRAVPVDDDSYAICVTQSGTLPSETYIVYEKQTVPDEPIPIFGEELTEVTEVNL